MKLVLVIASALLVCGSAMAHEPPMTGPAGDAATPAGAPGIGVIRKLDMKSGSVTLQHGPIAALGWPAMTMPFKADPSLLQGLKVGEKVNFTLKPGGASEIVAIKTAG